MSRPTIVVMRSRPGPQHPVEAQVIEDDTYHVLGAGREARELSGGPRRHIRAMEEAAPELPGSVLIRGDRLPIQLLAVVHDLDLDPSWRDEWVSAALGRILAETEARGITVLSMPVLGSVHGGMPAGTFARLLRDQLERVRLKNLETIWLDPPKDGGADALSPLARWLRPSVPAMRTAEMRELTLRLSADVRAGRFEPDMDLGKSEYLGEAQELAAAYEARARPILEAYLGRGLITPEELAARVTLDMERGVDREVVADRLQVLAESLVTD